MLPTLLLTRPEPLSRAFLAACEAAANRSLPAVIAPLWNSRPTGAAIPGEGELIVTSGRAVEAAGSLSGRLALCVGDRTAELARAAGAQAISAGGTQDDLLALILARSPAPLIYLRGDHPRGGLTELLRGTGRTVTEIRDLRNGGSRPDRRGPGAASGWWSCCRAGILAARRQEADRGLRRGAARNRGDFGGGGGPVRQGVSGRGRRAARGRVNGDGRSAAAGQLVMPERRCQHDWGNESALRAVAGS